VLLACVERVARLFGLALNDGVEKTAYMHLHAPAREGEPLRLGDGRIVPKVQKYKYLGWVCSKEGWRKDWARRRQLSAGLMHEYRSVWEHGTWMTRTHMFHSVIVPSITYALGTYPLTQTVMRTVTAWYQKLLRRAYGVQVDWGEYTHKPWEKLLPRHLTVLAQYAHIRLRELGGWIRAHNGGNLHPVLDVLAWDVPTRRTLSPKESLLKLACVRDWSELLRLATNEKRWLQHVHKCVLHMEMEVAEETGKRRAGEEGRNWLPHHTRMLKERRAAVVAKVLGKPKA
jgi:hypothetical protein